MINIYIEIADKFDELGLNTLREDWKQGDRDYTVVISFNGLIGCLIDLGNIQFEVEDNE